MAIKIPSINIRRLYTEEEYIIAEKTREIQYVLEDIKNYKKIKLLSENEIFHDKHFHELSRDEFISYFYYRNKGFNSCLKESMTNKKYNRDKDYVKRIQKFIKRNLENIDNKNYNKWCREDLEMKELRSNVKMLKLELEDLVLRNFKDIDKTRDIKTFYNSDYIDLFECELQESFEICNHEKSNKIIILKVDEHTMFKDIIFKGFVFNNHKYRLLSASAGQLRKTKVMFVEEDSYLKAEPRLTNGITIDVINKNFGVNITKWSAYLALSTSSTKEWKGFDLDRTIVVDDFETILKDRIVDNINSDFEKVRMKKDVLIPHTDGFGMTRKIKDTRVLRAPWIKGLVGYFDFISFIKEFNGDYIVKDIYGDSYDVRNIDTILTKSQFKMSGYYENWADYKDKFKKNNCKIRYMNSEKKKDLRLKAKFNYQMWNTLDVENTTEFIEYFLKEETEKLKKAHSEVLEMFEVFHVDYTNYNRNTNNLQKALYLYPSLFTTDVFKAPLKNMIIKKKNELKYGRIKINGVYTFIMPDTFAWSEKLFLKKENEDIQGLLQDGEVYCSLIKAEKEILVNRSPHLYKEHCIRKNVINNKTKKWFNTKGVYTSIHDMISKQLFFDVDGDIGLVVDNDYLVGVAKETMKDIVPLDFELAKAKSVMITPENIFNAYTPAFEINIGEYSNMITKIMSSDNKDMDLVAKICWLNNVFIDYAKTSWKPDIPSGLEKILGELKNRKLPNFFIYAKEKNPESVLSLNKNSVVDNMVSYVDNMMYDESEGIRKRVSYDFSNFTKFKISSLLVNKVENIEYDEGLIEKFEEMCMSKHKTMIRRELENMDEDEEINEREYIDNVLISEMYEYIFQRQIDLDLAIDILIKYVFKEVKNKDILFTVFGDIITQRLEFVFDSLENGNEKYCENCGVIIKKKSKFANIQYCESCANNIKKETKLKTWNKNKHKYR